MCTVLEWAKEERKKERIEGRTKERKTECTRRRGGWNEKGRTKIRFQRKRKFEQERKGRERNKH